MRVIITGGSGFIGQALAASLAGDQHEVIVLGRAARPQTALPDGVQWASWNGRNADGWVYWLQGDYAIVNLAGESIGGKGYLDIRWNATRKQRILESRVNAGKAVLAAVLQAGDKPRAVIQASAVGYYGPQGDTPLDESAPPGGDFLARVCCEWEASTAALDAACVRRAIARLGLVLDTRGGLLPRQMLPYRWFAGGPLGSGRQGYSWIHIRDAVRALRFLLDNEQAQGAYNLTAPQPLRFADFGKTLARALRRPYWLPVPAFALRLLFGEAATLLLDGQLILPQRLLAAGFQFEFPQAGAALNDLFAV